MFRKRTARSGPLSMVIVWLLMIVPAVADNERYHVVYRDGKSSRGKDLRDLFQQGKSPRLNGRDLFEAKNPALLLRDTQRDVQLETPYIELTNGDVLPGEVRRYGSGRNRAAHSAHYVVAVRQPWVVEHRKQDYTETRVRVAAVRRIVLRGRPLHKLSPGLVLLVSGQRLVAKSIRVVDAGVRVLTESQVQTIRMADVREIHLPNRGSFSVATNDLAWNQLAETSPLDTVCTTDGGRITFPYAATHRDSHWVIVKPVWAMDSIAFRYEMIASQSFRQTDELLLSLLPVAGAGAPHAGSSFRWRRNRSVLGGPLESGELAVDFGIGIHGSAAVAFNLPEGATEFNGYVGLNRAASRGGCVKCRLTKDTLNGHTLWQSGFIQGKDGFKRVGPIRVGGAKTLVLASDMAHRGRPSGADPLDIRDHVDWLQPMVKVDAKAYAQVSLKQSPWFAGLHGWHVSASDQKRLAARTVWDNRRWRVLLAPDKDKNTKDMKPLVFERSFKVTLNKTWLKFDAARDPRAQNEYRTKLFVDGEELPHVLERDINPSPFYSDKYDTPRWSLAKFVGKRVKVALHVEPLQRGGQKPAAIHVEAFEPLPLFRDVPAGGAPIDPDAPLTALKHTVNHKKHVLERGKVTGGKPLVMYGYAFDEGFGVHLANEDILIKYNVDPTWKRFVAVIGCYDDGYHAVGYKILADGKPIWETKEKFARGTRGLQLDIAIPEGAKTLSLSVTGDQSHAAFGNAGFMTGE